MGVLAAGVCEGRDGTVDGGTLARLSRVSDLCLCRAVEDERVGLCCVLRDSEISETEVSG